MKYSLNKFDSIVVGSGMGGIAAARILAEFGGQRVLLVEQHFKPGGMTHEFERKGKYHFGTGLHYVGLKGENDFPAKFLDYLSDGKVAWAALPDNYDNFVYPNYSFSMSSKLDVSIDRLIARFPSEEKSIRSYYKQLSHNARGLFVIHTLSSMPTFLRWALLPLGKWLFRDSLKTAEQYLNEHFDDPMLKTILSSVWGDVGTPPSRMAFGYLAMLHWHYEKGGSFPVGGLKALTAAMVKGLQRFNVEIVTRRVVTDIKMKQGQIVGVDVINKNNGKKESYYADTVVSDAGAYNTYVRMLGNADYKERLAQLGTSTSACVLFLGLNASPKSIGLEGGNIWIFPSTDHEKNYNALPGEGLLYLSFPSLKNPDSTYHTMEIVTMAHRSQFENIDDVSKEDTLEKYEAFKEKIASRIIERINEIHPGFKNLIDYKEVGTPLTFENFQNSPLGQFYGLPTTKERLLSPVSRCVSSVKGLYLAGQDVLSPGIIPAALGGMEAGISAIGKTKARLILSQIGARQNPCPSPEILAQKRENVLHKTSTDNVAWRGKLFVSGIQDETPGVKTFILTGVNGELPFSFIAGQYLRVFLPLKRSLIRNYTIASAPSDNTHVHLTIKKEENGKGSTFLHEHVSVGDLLEVEAPYGHFTLSGISTETSLVLIAGGVGITPLVSVIRELVMQGSVMPVTLLYGCRSPNSIIFHKELLTIAKKHRWFSYTPVVSEADDSWNGKVGRIEKDTIKEINDLLLSRIHICGPKPMMTAIKAILNELNVPGDNIHTESFVGTAQLTENQGESVSSVSITFGNQDRRVEGKTNQTFLEIAQSQSVDIPYECMAGVCGACKMKVIEGDFTMPEADALSGNEREEKIILSCQARPNSDCIVKG